MDNPQTQITRMDNPQTQITRMDNPQTQITLGTKQRMKRNNPKNTTHKTKKMSNTDPTKKPGMNTGEG